MLNTEELLEDYKDALITIGGYMMDPFKAPEMQLQLIRETLLGLPALHEEMAQAAK